MASESFADTIRRRDVQRILVDAIRKIQLSGQGVQRLRHRQVFQIYVIDHAVGHVAWQRLGRFRSTFSVGHNDPLVEHNR